NTENPYYFRKLSKPFNSGYFLALLPGRDPALAGVAIEEGTGLVGAGGGGGRAATVAAALQMIGTELIRLLAQNAIEGLDEHENRIVHQSCLGLQKSRVRQGSRVAGETNQ
ncbi:hypothetical protein M5D96_006158, partial [Drosophila gunungcola]